MSKKDKISFIIATVLVFAIMFVCAALNDDRILSQANFAAIITISLIAYIGYIAFLLKKHFAATKRAKERRLSSHSAILSATLKHTDGLPLAKGVMVEVYYGRDKITFKKDRQEISVAIDKVTSIDCVTGKDIKAQQMAGAATGKYLLGGMTGAVIGSLAATTTYLVISYQSDGKDKYVVLDTAASGTFALKAQKDFRQYNRPIPSKIEL